MRVLLIEDDAALASIISEILHREDMLVDTVSDAAHAKRLIGRHCYGAAILDITQPLLGGAALACQVRAAVGNMPILLLSSGDMVDVCVRGLELGADDYLIKPIVHHELITRLRIVLQRRGPGNRLRTVMSNRQAAHHGRSIGRPSLVERFFAN